MSAVEEQAPQGEVEGTAMLPILPLRESVVFPASVTPLAIGQERSIRLVDEAVANDLTIALVTSRDPEEEADSAEDLYEVGTSAVVHKMVRVPDGTLRVLVQGLDRIRLDSIEQTEPYLTGLFTPLPDVVEREKEVEALARSVEALFGRIISIAPYLPEELLLAAANAESPSQLANLIASTHPPEDGGEAGPPRGGRRRGAPAAADRDPLARAGGLRAGDEDPVPGAGGDGQVPAGVLPAPAAEGDPGGARRGRTSSRRSSPSCAHRSRRRSFPRTPTSRRGASSTGSPSSRPRPPSTASSARTSSGSFRSPGTRRPRTTSTSRRRAPDPRRGPLRPREGQGANHRAPGGAEADEQALRPHPRASSGRPASARPRSDSRSHARSAASSCASPSAACATRPRSAATGAPTSAPCPGRSSARSATPARRTRSS